MEESCVTDEIGYKCTICDELFPSPEMLQKHTLCHIKKIYSCDICSKVFRDSHELGRHYVVHTTDALFFCDVCNAGFIQESELKCHKDEKHKPTRHSKIFQCYICEKRFKTAISLDRHYSFHIGGKPFMCKVCNVSFALASHFEKHNQVEHPPFSDETNRNWKLYSCDYCPLTFVVKKTLSLHVATHKHKNNYGCEECSESFTQELDLEEHYSKHIEEYYRTFEFMASFGCSICYKFFPLISDLEEHKLSHEDYISIGPLTFSDDLVNNMLSDTSKSEADFIVNCVINTHDNTQSRDDPIINFPVSSELLMQEDDNLQVFDSDITNNENVETFYIITENEDGTFESSVLDGNCVVFIDDDSQIHDVELSESQISTNHEFEKTSEIPEGDSDPIGTIGTSDIENDSIALAIPLSTVKDVEIAAVENIEVSTSNSMVPTVHYVESNKISDQGIGKSSPVHSKSETCTDIAHVMSEIANSPSLKLKRIWTCNVCQKSFNTSESLRLHSDIHNREKPFPCDVCKQAFRYESTLILHRSTHETLEPYVCEECGKSFPTQHCLKLHSSYHAKQYICDICGIKLKTKSTLKFHQYTHTTFRPFKCEICDMGFFQKHKFELHLKVHRGEPLPHTCTDCGKVCRSYIYLKRHKMQHSGIKPYPCDLCPKAFTSKASMEKHFLVEHTKEGKYRCNACGKPFHILEDCRKHMQSHAREQKYECDVCGMKFAAERNLQFHYVRHTNKDPFSCDVCDIRFTKKRELAIHKKKIHAPNP